MVILHYVACADHDRWTAMEGPHSSWSENSPAILLQAGYSSSHSVAECPDGPKLSRGGIWAWGAGLLSAYSTRPRQDGLINRTAITGMVQGLVMSEQGLYPVVVLHNSIKYLDGWKCILGLAAFGPLTNRTSSSTRRPDAPPEHKIFQESPGTSQNQTSAREHTQI